MEELAQQVQKATESLEKCMEVANRINSELPEKERLEHFRIQTTSRLERETPERWYDMIGRSVCSVNLILIMISICNMYIYHDYFTIIITITFLCTVNWAELRLVAQRTYVCYVILLAASNWRHEHCWHPPAASMAHHMCIACVFQSILVCIHLCVTWMFVSFFTVSWLEFPKCRIFDFILWIYTAL